MKKLKILLVVLMLIIVLFLCSGCGYFEVKERRQYQVEKAIKHLNTKYAEDPSFKKYERKDVISNDDSFFSDVFSGIAYDICGNNLGTGSNAPTVVSFKDGTKVYDGNSDTKQQKIIREDFEKYFYNEIINEEYTNDIITEFSQSYLGMPNTESVFDTYYDGDMENYITENEIVLRGNITILIDRDEFDEYYTELIERIKNMKMNLAMYYNILFIDKDYKNLVEKKSYSDDFDNESFSDEKILSIVKLEGHVKNLRIDKYVNYGYEFGILFVDKDLNFDISLKDIIITKSNLSEEELIEKADIIKSEVGQTGRSKLNDNSYIVCYEDVYENAVYNVRFSERLNNAVKESGKGYIYVSLRVDSLWGIKYTLLSNET